MKFRFLSLVFPVIFLFSGVAYATEMNNIKGSHNLNSGLKAKGNGILSPDELFEKLAIKVKDKIKRRYIYGDNKAGFAELFTNSYGIGNLYTISGYPVLKDFATFSDGKLLDRESNNVVTSVFPYGSVVETSQGKEEFMLLKNSQTVLLSVKNNIGSKLGILPVFTFSGNYNLISEKNKIIIQLPDKEKGYPSFIVIKGNKDFKIGKTDKKFKNIFEYKPSLITIKPEKEFTISITFSNTSENAIKESKEIFSKDPVIIQKQKIYDFLIKSYLWTSDTEFNRALMWSKISAYMFFTDQFGKGIWAGLPWFRDNWGRDTFISLPGTLLVNGEAENAKALINNFSRYQNTGDLYLDVQFIFEESKDKAIKFITEKFKTSVSQKDSILTTLLPKYYSEHENELNKSKKILEKIEGIKVSYRKEKGKNFGRIPNRVTVPQDIIYNTTDGTPWMIREIYEYIKYSGDMEYAKSIYPVIKLAIDSAIKNYSDEYGFLTHADADTWMDAKFDEKPWSPRGNRANDIQALWFTSLKIGSSIAKFNNDNAKSTEWEKIADKLKSNFLKFFWDSNKMIMADRIKPDASPDFTLRPNQLMLVTVPLIDNLIDPKTGALVVKNTVSGLMYPYGILSLSPEDKNFHPYHTTSGKFEKDAAYHNGTIWGWNSGFAISALNKYGYYDFSYKLTQNLSWQILNLDCIGTMSELVEAFPDKKGKITPSGTYSQAWSVAEFNRNAYQDYLGFKPDLINNTIEFEPLIPSEWKEFNSNIDFGKNNNFSVVYKKSGTENFIIKVKTADNLKLNFINDFNGAKYLYPIALKNNETNIIMDRKQKLISINNQEVQGKEIRESYMKLIGNPEFLKPDLKRKYPSVTEKDYLRNSINKDIK